MKRRTGLLFSSAVVLGLAGGAVGGFLIQRSRPATPLPPIQRTLAVAAVPGLADPHDPKTDDGAKLDGDLRALLLATPAGAKDTTDFAVRDWFTIESLAEYYGKPQNALVKLNSYTFRRAARTAWTLTDGTDVEVDLVQFRSTEGASSYFTMTRFPEDATAPTVQGTATGYVGQYYSPDGSGQYMAYGLVRHGDVVAQVFMSRAKSAPSEDQVMQVTKSQADLL
ncbi:hypothetical protein [Catenulispora pinisilvae]|uniref:hypothetical protein n=1 Tax=Catenulispora pinisilvae TaxID=2705253 RepID=UPI0018928577|nr:hypothetical protein [Catenulispora pinisilvae]